MIQAGANVIASELHPYGTASADCLFGLQLLAEYDPARGTRPYLFSTTQSREPGRRTVPDVDRHRRARRSHRSRRPLHRSAWADSMVCP